MVTTFALIQIFTGISRRMLRVKMQSTEQYESVMRDAKETVLIVAARRGINTNLIDIEIDAGLGPGQHQQHVLVISVRGAPMCVIDRNIAHNWLAHGTGFIHDRFATLVAALLSKLMADAEKVGKKLLNRA